MKEVNSTKIPSATIILVRERNERLQVYLLRRSLKSGFMAGNFVFPGGKIDASDQDAQIWQRHIDLNSNELSRHLGGSGVGDDILAYGVAAIRETFEEAGVFFADTADTNAFDLDRLNTLRQSGELHGEWLMEMILSNGWTLSLSLLSRWSHWVTPLLMKKRYDTRFFLAVLPSGQTCLPDKKETIKGLWISPEKGLAGNLKGEIPLSPPTLVTLHELMSYPHLEDLEKKEKDRQWGRALLPRLVPLDGSAIILEPWDPEYHEKQIGCDLEKLSKSILPVGEPFSRLWLDKGIWKPVLHEKMGRG